MAYAEIISTSVARGLPRSALEQWATGSLIALVATPTMKSFAHICDIYRFANTSSADRFSLNSFVEQAVCKRSPNLPDIAAGEKKYYF